jgi:hypothetical protein
MATRCGWASRQTITPLLPSGVSHGVPWGLSIVVGEGAPELRVFLEAQSDPPSAATYARAARDVTEFAAARAGATLERLHVIEPWLVSPDGSPLRTWHGVAFAPSKAPAFRVYRCLAGAARCDAAFCALARLGFEAALARVRDSLRAEDRVTIVSLDLLRGADARAKLYVLMPNASADELGLLYERAEDARRGDALLFARAMLGGVERPIWWLVCFAFTAASRDRPTSAALHFGVPRHVPDDAIAHTRLLALFTKLGLDGAAYERCRAALGPGHGLHHFVSFQRLRGRPRVTVYFMPEAARP